MSKRLNKLVDLDRFTQWIKQDRQWKRIHRLRFALRMRRIWAETPEEAAFWDAVIEANTIL